MDKLHRTMFKAAQKYAREERSIRPVLVGIGAGELKSVELVRGGNSGSWKIGPRLRTHSSIIACHSRSQVS
jgi:hypothetical protein